MTKKLKQRREFAPSSQKSDTALLTEFQCRVLKACSHIPKGKVISYGALAKSIRCRSAQAVGQALRRNPFAPDVPCHRVVNQARKLNGFEGKTSDTVLAKKHRLLKEEGVKFENANTIAPCSFLTKFKDD